MKAATNNFVALAIFVITILFLYLVVVIPQENVQNSISETGGRMNQPEKLVRMFLAILNQIEYLNKENFWKIC